MSEIWTAAWTPVFPQIDFSARLEWLRGHLDALEAAGGRVTLACDEIGPVGFSVFDPASCDMDQLCVAPRAQGAGVAAALLDALKRESPLLTLAVNRDNARARRFYEREGFVQTGEGISDISQLPILFMRWRRDAG